MSKHVLRVLGVSLLAALGLMAFAASGAQAANLTIAQHVHGEILIENKVLHVSVGGIAETEGRLLVPNLGIEITCKDFEVLKGLVNQTAAKGHGTAVVLFLECKVYSIEKVLPFNLTSPTALPCLPLDSETVKDGHIKAEALVLVILHEGKDYLVFEQINLEATKPLSIIKYTPETGCPIPLKQEVFGQYAFEIITGDKHTGPEVVEPLITAGNHKTLQELLGLTLKYGVNEGFLDGSAKLFLTDEAHKGLKWGVL